MDHWTNANDNAKGVAGIGDAFRLKPGNPSSNLGTRRLKHSPYCWCQRGGCNSRARRDEQIAQIHKPLLFIRLDAGFR